MSMYDRDWYRESRIDYDNGGLIRTGKKRYKFNWKIVGFAIIAAILSVLFFLYSANS